MSDTTARATRPLETLRPLIRSLCGGFIFSIPIIYTMEMWSLGHNRPAMQILAFVALSYLVAVGLNYVSGFREAYGWGCAFKDAVETLALGIAVSAVMLVLLGVADANGSAKVFLSQVMMLAIPISIGASLSRSQLGEKGADGDGPEKPAEDERPGWHNDLKDLALTAFGGVFLGFSVAPTEEILLIATQGRWWQALGTIALSLGITYLMLFEARFVGESQRLETPGMFQGAWPETLVTYAVSLGISAYLLWFLGDLPLVPSPSQAIAMTIVLALPVSMGGAVARMIL